MRDLFDDNVSLLEKDFKKEKRIFTTKFIYTFEDIKVKQNDDDQKYFINEISDFKIFKEN